MKRNYGNNKGFDSRFLRIACILLCLLFSTSIAFGQMAAGKTKWVGNIWYNGSEPLKFSQYWNQLTPENAGKWDAVEGTRDVMNWSQVDAMYNYCKSKGYPFKQHCFVWGSQQPSWIGSLSQADQKAEVEEWIRLYGERYPDTDFIDVVNEMFHVTPVYKDAIGGNGSTGWDWVVWAFEKARQYCPKAKLLINEYNVIEGWTPVSDYVNLVNILKSRGLIDGIGVQNHGLESTSLTDVTNRLNQLGSGTGLPIYVSELDLVFSDENAQATRYAQLFPVLYENQYVAGITLWGYLEGHHWRDNAWIMRADGSERPALTAIKNYLASAPTGGPTTVPTATPTSGPTAAPTATPGPTGVANGSISIACGSSADVGSFQPDQYFSGGSTFNNTNTVDISQITSNPPPALLFNNERYGAMSYTIPGFAAGSANTVTLYFAETYLTSSGSRLFNVSVNGAGVLTNFDIYASAGGQNKAIARSFATTADSSGQIVIQFSAVTENPKINGISINPGSSGGTRGDVNGSGTIDIVDALLIAQAYVGLNPSNYNAAYADVNCSGSVDIVDALLVAQYYVGLISGFPC